MFRKSALKNIGTAFLPMNQPYTMKPDRVADVTSDAAEYFIPIISAKPMRSACKPVKG
jgi:hypothetical protein